MQLFGIMSYCLAAFALVFAVFYVRKKTPPHILLLSAGFLLLFLSLSALLQIFAGQISVRTVSLPFSGLLGMLLERTLVSIFSYFGSLLIAFVILIISLFLIVQVPILSILEQNMIRRRSVERTKEIKVVEEPPPKPREEEPKEKKVVQESFEFVKDISPYQLPPTSLLDAVEKREMKIDKESLQVNARILEKKLQDYGIDGRVTEVHPGPVITMYEFEPAPGIKVSRISNLADDLAMALTAVSIRIIAPIPGKAVVGIEVPNKVRQTVYLRDIIESGPFASSRSYMTLALGKTIAGEPFVAELDEDAPPPRRRFHGLRQERLSQQHDLQHPLQGQAPGCSAPDDRSQDAGVVVLRGDPSPAPARRHQRHERKDRAALGHRRDGAAVHGSWPKRACAASRNITRRPRKTRRASPISWW